MTDQSDDFLLRPMGEDDRNYVLSAFLNDFQRSKWAKVVGGAYFTGHARLIQKLMDHASVTLCVWKDSPDFIIGFAVSGPGAVVHYVYVRKDWREKGIAKMLLAPFLGKHCRVTHAVTDKRLPDKWTLDPYPLTELGAS